VYLFARLSARAPQMFAALIVFSLSAGVLGGILFYMDSTSTEVLEDMRQAVAVDMQVRFTSSFYGTSTISRQQVKTIVQQQSEVAAAELVIEVDSSNYTIQDVRYRSSMYLGIDETFFASFPSLVQLESGNTTLASNECYLETATMERLSLQIGDTFNISVSFFDALYKQNRVRASFIVAGAFQTSAFYEYYASSDEWVTSLQMLAPRSTFLSNFSPLFGRGYSGIKDGVWARIRDSVLTQGGARQVKDTLDNVKKRIEQSSLPYAVVSEYDILNIVNSYASWSSAMVTVALAFSMPSLVMGVMLVQYQSNLVADERRRDVGTLVTRGSSGWQAFNWVISSALITGIVGSGGAVGAGLLASILAGSVRETMVFQLNRLASFPIRLEPLSVTVVFLFSFTVGFLVSLPAAVRALLTSPADAHTIVERQESSTPERLGNPSIELAAAAVSFVLLVPMLSVFQATGFIGSSNLIYAFSFILLIGTLIISLTRLLSRPTASLKARLLERWGRRTRTIGARILARNLLVFKKSEAMGSFFVAMVFTAGLFSAIAANTGTQHMENLIQFQTGAAIAIDVKQGWSNVTTDLVDQIAQIPEVSSAAGMILITAFLTYSAKGNIGLITLNKSIRLYGVQPANWEKAAYWENYYSLNGNPSAALDLLQENSSKIISSFRPLWDTTDGHPVYNNNMTVEIRTPWENYSKQCMIVDVFAPDSDAGGTTYLPGEPDSSDFVIMNLAYVDSCINSTRVDRIYVGLKEQANYTKVMSEIQQLAPYSFASIESSQQMIDSILDSRAGQAIQGVYTLNIVFSLIYLTLGMTIVALVKSRNLRKQYSVLRALGAKERSIVVAALVDSVIGIAFSAIVGLVIGLGLTAVILQMPLVYTGLSITIQWTRLPVFISIPQLLAGGILGSAFVFTLSSIYMVTRNVLSKNIAEEIQHNE
jgi:ABC-type lipoprotein release transport system permease subunit